MVRSNNISNSNNSKVRMLRAALAVLLLVCTASSSTAGASEQTSRELADDTTALGPFTTAPPVVSSTLTSPPVSVSIVAPAMTAIVAGTDTNHATSLAVKKLTPSPSLIHKSSAALLENDVSATPTATELTEPGVATASAPLVNSLKASTTSTPTPEPKTDLSGTGSGSAASGSNNSSSSSSSDTDGYESGSGSNRTYACACSELRKVSLMGYADYCLSHSTVINNKCGNRNLGKGGECPRQGAMPCSNTGYVLTKDSLCLEDDDGVFKCVLSAEDLEIKKNGGKKKKTKKTVSNSNSTIGADAKSGAALLHRASPALRVVTLIASVALGVVALL